MRRADKALSPQDQALPVLAGAVAVAAMLGGIGVVLLGVEAADAP